MVFNTRKFWSKVYNY